MVEQGETLVNRQYSETERFTPRLLHPRTHQLKLHNDDHRQTEHQTAIPEPGAARVSGSGTPSVAERH
jgi:hypothetical protein